MKKMLSVFLWGMLIILFANCSSGDGNDSTNNSDTKTASFTLSRTWGTTSTVFSFDASGSTDNHDSTSLLEVRWDWENDGTFDTDWTTRKVATHQYSTTGAKTINLEVRNTEGMVHRAKETIIVYRGCGTLTDWDGNTYETVKIGNQCWMAENFKGTHYRNGYPIPNVIDNHDWSFMIETRTGAYCNYDNDDNENVIIYGRLYNWYAASSPSLPPEGWHLPSFEDWKTLIEYLGGYQWAAPKLMEQTCLHWNCVGDGGSNESGFSALPGGQRDAWNDNATYIQYRDLGEKANFWSSSEKDEYSAGIVSLNLAYAHYNGVSFWKNDGLSIRFVKDND